MMNSELISIVVPVYNVKKYLDKCVVSLVNQTYQELQIILVDDGSTDGSGKICEEYAKKDKRIIVIHKENGGLSDARNIGIQFAKGNYITFVDSDDWLETDIIEIYYNLIKEYKADITICDFIYQYENAKRRPLNIHKKYCKPEVFDKKTAIKEMVYTKKFASHACNKLFKKELFNDIQFPLGKYYEDLFIMYKIFEKANCIVYISRGGYNYYIRNDSISTRDFNLKHLDYIEASDNLVKYFLCHYPDIIRVAKLNYQRNVMQTIDKFLKSNCTDIKLEKKLFQMFNKYHVMYNLFDFFEAKLALKRFVLKYFLVFYKKMIAGNSRNV